MSERELLYTFKGKSLTTCEGCPSLVNLPDEPNQQCGLTGVQWDHDWDGDFPARQGECIRAEAEARELRQELLRLRGVSTREAYEAGFAQGAGKVNGHRVNGPYPARCSYWSPDGCHCYLEADHSGIHQTEDWRPNGHE